MQIPRGSSRTAQWLNFIVALASLMMAFAELVENLTCCICQNMYTDPITLPCGHNLCQVCTEDLLRGQDTTGHYSCPQCRAQFSSRPDVQKNTDLNNLVTQIRSIQEKEELLGTCILHGRPLEYYCSEDSARICTGCCQAAQHRGHELLTLDVACEKKKEDLRNIYGHLVSGEEEEKESQYLQHLHTKMKNIASTMKERTTVLLQGLRDQLTVLERTTLCDISTKEQQVSSSVSQKLKVMKDNLYCKKLFVEELCTMMDDLTLLQADIDGLSCADQGDNGGDGAPGLALDEDLISDNLHSGIADIMTSVTGGIYVQGALDVTLNINTAGSSVHVSDDLKTASWSGQNQNHAEHPERFEFNQVLSVRSFCNRRLFWEVETSETGNWMIGMAYISIDRLGRESLVGDNKKSWCIRRYDNEYTASHDRRVSELPHRPSLPTFRIYLDYQAGQLSFYELGPPTRHLYTFTASFTEPLHVIIWVWSSWVKIKS